MEKKHVIYNVLILDESGSMESIKKQTISGFNELVQTIKLASEKFHEQEHRVIFATFNGDKGTKILIDNQSVETIKEIKDGDYLPSASTPLYDAMGFVFTRLMNETYGHENFNVLVTILTDGEENASREYKNKTIKELVEKLKDTGKWTFTYIGANQDVMRVAESMSINNSMAFEADEVAMKKMFEKEQSSRMRFMTNMSMQSDKASVSKMDYFDKEDES